MASLGEETRASCRGPSNHNAVALILPHKAMLGFDGGAIGADIYCDRSGIHCRTIADCAKVLDALKDPEERLLRPARPLHDGAALVGAGRPTRATPRASGAPGALKGVRIGVIRESMVYPPGSKTEEPIVDAPRPRRSRRCWATGSARRWSSRPIRSGRRIPTSSR